MDIREESNCTEQLFGTYNGSTYEKLLILLCAVEGAHESNATRRRNRLGNPLGERRKSYPDSKLKKTIDANLTAAKAEFPTCKNGSLSMDFESLSELVMDSSKLFDMYDNVTDGTNGILQFLSSLRRTFRQYHDGTLLRGSEIHLPAPVRLHVRSGMK